jgi:Uma2 family endonuclease
MIMTALTDAIFVRPSPVSGASTETVGDLLARLGGVSPARVRLRPAPGTATVADVVAIEASEKRLFELVDGVLVEKCMGFWESYLAGLILTALNTWVIPRHLGIVTGADGMIRLFPNQVRMPDVAFAAWSHFPGGKPTNDPVPLLAPDLAVEVLSENNTDAEMKRKREEYFQAGVKLLWLVDPKARTVTVFTSADNSVILRDDQVLDGGSVLPGFALSLKDLFGEVKA